MDTDWIEALRQTILRGRQQPFVTVKGREGPILYRPLTAPCLADAFTEVEERQLRVEAVGVSSQIFAEMRKFGLGILDIESHAQLLKAGLQANLWGARLLTFHPKDLGDDELILVDGSGGTTRFQIAEGYPHEVKIEVRVFVDGAEPAIQTDVVPFAEVEHLDKLLQHRFPTLVGKAIEEGIRPAPLRREDNERALDRGEIKPTHEFRRRMGLILRGVVTEAGMGTPDNILAAYLRKCLERFPQEGVSGGEVLENWTRIFGEPPSKH
jgi:hypothetical protein